jgi:WD40 repeat protein
VISPDEVSGRYAEEGNFIRVWDATTGKVLRSFPGNPRGMSHLTLSPDGKTLAGVFGNCEIQMWDLASGRVLGTLGEDFLLQVSFAPDGKTLASIGGNAGIHLWDPATGQLFRKFGATTHVVKTHDWCIAYAPDGRSLAAGRTGVLQLWDPKHGKQLWDRRKGCNDYTSETFRRNPAGNQSRPIELGEQSEASLAWGGESRTAKRRQPGGRARP